MLKRNQSLEDFLVFLSNIALLLFSQCPIGSLAATNLLFPSDATSLLAFKSKADLRNNLKFSQNTTLHFCQWQGVTCSQGKVVRLVLESLDLVGVLAPNTVTHLDQLRVLSLQNNSLTGPIPDFFGLSNLKTLFLDHNSFIASFPPSIFSLHRLCTLDFSYNNLTGPIPTWLLERLIYSYYWVLLCVFILVSSLLCFVMAVKKQRNQKESTAMIASDAAATAEAAAVIQIEQEHELEEKVKRVQGMQVAKSGNLVFSAGEAQLYSLDQLMRGSTELLGIGTMGTTYKAVLDNRLIVSVKRLDASKLAETTKEMFEQHMAS